MWILFVILVQPTQFSAGPVSYHTTMEECFAAREYFMETAPKPKMNYEAVCVQTDVAN